MSLPLATSGISALRSLGLAVVFFSLVLPSACSPPPDPQVVDALTSGLWHTPLGEDDYIYELTFKDGALRGRLHRVNQGRQMLEIPVTRVELWDTTIQIEHRGFPAFLGEADLTNGRIEGGIPHEPAFQNIILTRVESTMWTMTRPSTGPGVPADVWSRPENHDDGWLTGAPEEVGIDRTAVNAMIRAILKGEAAALHSLLVVRDGRLVVEEYFCGWGREDLHHIASCTKSVASLLVGLAVDRGLIDHVHIPLLDFFPERVGAVGQGWDEIELEHLLTMTMGLDWEKFERHGWPPLNDQAADILARNREAPPGKRFRYTDRNVNLLAGVLLEATGVEADLFAGEHLFSPLGINNWDWEHRRWLGHPDMMAALKLRPRDMAKLGQLVLDEGRWQGREVVSTAWIRRSTRPHIEKTPYDEGYGYLWWCVAPPDSPLGAVTFANGMGTQFIAVIPEARLILVTTGGNDYNGRQFDIVQLAERYLLPGIR